MSMNETFMMHVTDTCTTPSHYLHTFTFRLFRFKFYTREDVGQYEDLNTTASGCREVCLFSSLITWIDSVTLTQGDRINALVT